MSEKEPKKLGSDGELPTRGLIGPVPEPRVDDVHKGQEDDPVMKPSAAGKERQPRDKPRAPEGHISGVHLPENIPKHENQVKEEPGVGPPLHPRSHQRPEERKEGPGPSNPRNAQEARDRQAPEQRERHSAERRQELVREFAQRQKMHAVVNRKRAEKGIPPLPPLRAPWDLPKRGEEIPMEQNEQTPGGRQEHKTDPRGEPEMTPADFAWVSQISIVISWVNGSDPEYQKIRARGGADKVGGSRDRDSG